MLRAHKIRLYPNNKQETHLLQSCGVARFSYNWALGEWGRQYKEGLKPSEMSLRKQLNAVKREEFPWMMDVSKCAPQEAIINLGIAFKNFFAGRAKYPRFKKKGRRDSFKLTVGQFEVKNFKIRIPKIGLVKMREALRFSGRPVSVTISRIADEWYASIAVETNDLPAKCENQAAVGVDLGIKMLATFSDDRQSIEGAKAFKVLLPRLRRLSRSVSRKVKGSCNRKKAVLKLAKLHARIANVRNDSIHKLTTMLTSSYAWIAIEDLNVKGMMSNGKLARHIADGAFSEVRRQLEYKAKMRENHVAVVSRWFPSSKTCNVCGCINKFLTLADREWTCLGCGAVHDRDKNAAKNILAVSCTVTACGGNGAGSGRKTGTKLSPVKQEYSSKSTFNQICVGL
ncbi:MAG TPA: RNA-guided endonuclease TnpB family protein [Candidatus Brocadiaceae bacterium]|nr:RNA-guided endonuclease TnpB family protein [Candidatus Brocadiaceae bacterium]